MSVKVKEIFFNIPDISSLYTIELKIFHSRSGDWRETSNFHWQIFNARQMIFELPQVLVCKCYDPSILIAIMKQDFYESLSFVSYAATRHLEIKSVNNTTSRANFANAFKYTLYARLAPMWNPIQDYLVRGRNFLFEKNILSAIDMSIAFENDNTLVVILKAFQVKTSNYPQIDDFNLNLNLIKQYESGTDVKINPIVVFKLPNLVRGEIVSISRNLQPNCPIPSYDEMRRHWKNMYGYRLPASNDGRIFYINIRTKFGNTYLYNTYPNICVRWIPIELLENTTASLIDTMDHFIESISFKMSPFVLQVK